MSRAFGNRCKGSIQDWLLKDLGQPFDRRITYKQLHGKTQALCFLYSVYLGEVGYEICLNLPTELMTIN